MVSASKRQMSLGAFVTAGGHHVAGWRHPDMARHLGNGFNFYTEVARIAEQAKFDLVFLADTVSGVDPALGEGAAYMVPASQYDPLTILPALAARTERIGLVATATTTYNEPYHIARKIGTLDALSGGRVGWNLVTSALPVEAYNFNRDSHVAHDDRYERAEEFADVVTGLWDSWEEGAYPANAETGVFVDLGKLHVLNHVGKHFSVKGPLSCERSPQGRPVMVQAGSSGPGVELAARTAEVIFTAQPALDAAQAFYANVKNRMAAYGRHPDQARIMPGLLPIVGGTLAEANEKLEQLQSLIHPKLGFSLLQRTLAGFDLSGVDLHAPPPAALWNQSNSRVAVLLEMARRENLTMWQIAQRVAISRGHNIVVGTPETIADLMQTWFESAGADGFNVMAPYFTGGLTDFTDHVVPELQRRGIFRREYQGTTLRDHLGFPKPQHPASTA